MNAVVKAEAAGEAEPSGRAEPSGEAEPSGQAEPFGDAGLPVVEPGYGEVWTERYSGALMNTFGPPQKVLVRGEGVYVWDADGRRYLDLLAGIAVNALGHAHPLIVQAVTTQLTTLGHISNFFASAPQIVLAERLVELLREAHAGAAVPAGAHTGATTGAHTGATTGAHTGAATSATTGAHTAAQAGAHTGADVGAGAGAGAGAAGAHTEAGTGATTGAHTGAHTGVTSEPDIRVYFCNSGAEANEAAFKVARRTGRTKMVSTEGSFHGRTMGALALTGKAVIREPFEPLPGDVTFVPYGDVAALEAAIDDQTAAFIVEPIQGEKGVVPAPPGYLKAAREITARHGALLILDEIQTGIGRTGQWFAHGGTGVVPDVVTLAKGLGGGMPIGACIGIGQAAALLGPGQHGSTYAGNPVACAAGLAVLHAIERDDILANVRAVGARLSAGITGLGHPAVAGVRGEGLLLAVMLTGPYSADVAKAALEAGFIINAPAPDAIRLAPPLILTAAQADEFVAALPAFLDTATALAAATPKDA